MRDRTPVIAVTAAQTETANHPNSVHPQTDRPSRSARADFLELGVARPVSDAREAIQRLCDTHHISWAGTMTWYRAGYPKAAATGG